LTLLGAKAEFGVGFSAPSNARQIAVRDATRHAWKAYRTFAWGYDELQPISKTSSAWFGLGLTIVDGIDTLYIMNMTEGGCRNETAGSLKSSRRV
jgi:hypothetical protein